ncbi:PRC-barrel domain-containing protein [Natrinema salaciae]|uniref:Sporulation protein YlmC, PRC-barrel domain family n=1 Tax=Natrinema salaciae TaxID=1186196 RepID=A0A1H9LCE9_9EURY|nr:PRC-barrel domain-containing protein [Natrinema salaciae]SER09181.1 Sporulation protein YlmC, PRC-barrel domain family [Natrinema salaciae]
MNELLARNLSGKPIVGIDGTDFGTLSTVTMDPESGALRDLVVDRPSRLSSTAPGRPDDDGRLRIPVSHIETVNDQIVVRRAD